MAKPIYFEELKLELFSFSALVLTFFGSLNLLHSRISWSQAKASQREREGKKERKKEKNAVVVNYDLLQ